VVDVGARGGLQHQWRRIRDLCLFVGFEPEAAEAARLKKGALANELYVDSALHSKPGIVPFHHCVVPARSSLYLPDPEVIADVYGTSDHYAIGRTDEVTVTTLDALASTGTVPFANIIKLDTQGSELDILKGAARSLNESVIAIEAEVEFVPLYKGQPLFGDVDAFLRSAGYELMGFRRLHTRADVRFGQRGDLGYANTLELVRSWAARLIPPQGSWTGFSQLVYGDALYVRRAADYLQKTAAIRTDALLAIVKAVVAATELHFYGYAGDVLAGAARASLITDTDRDRLETFVRKRSRDIRPAFAAARRQWSRLLNRLRRPGRRL
jgi:FkbM family methyltransferase